MVRRIPLLLALVASLALAAGPAAGQPSAWSPPDPAVETLDWIRISSGEWLRGTVELLRDESLDFDSEEFDLVTVDWADVEVLRSPRILTYAFADDTVLVGSATVQDGTITIGTDSGPVTRPAASVRTILAGPPTEWNLWSGKVALNVIVRSGNTNQEDLNSLLRLKREATGTRLDLRYEGNVGALENEQNINNHRGTAAFDVFVSRRFFVTAPSVELLADKFQNIALRTSVGAGVGYYLYRESGLEWYVGVGPGFQNTKYRSVAPGESRTDETASAVFSTNLETDLTDDVELEIDYKVQVGVPVVENAVHNLVALLSVDLFGDLDFTASFTWDRTETPQPNAEGVVPERDDFRTAYGLGLDF
jgi:putative salt-induced outer membrane protein YdiY